MNLYSNKQRWKILLLFIATVIVGITLWYSNYIASKIEEEERQQIQLWSDAVKKRAQLVVFTERLFDQLRSQERKQADLIVKGYEIIADPNDNTNLTFVTDYLFSNTTIPLLIFNNSDKLTGSRNLPPGKENDTQYVDSLKQAMKAKNKPIVFEDIGHKVYYDDSYLFQELQQTMEDLIKSFISETVINSASVPLIMTDSTHTIVYRAHNLDTNLINTPELLSGKLSDMAEANPPIEIELPEKGKQYIFYENSLILTQLKYFPAVQLILVGVFLFIAYLIFSTFRKAEQNQVWVGMAKETAHQLGTPLSSLMAWMSILESQGVDKGSLVEINKDVERLEMITNRFSKIGSKPDLEMENVAEVVKSAFGYLQHRMSRRVKFEITAVDENIYAYMSRPLFGWVLENLVKNAVDAMEGEGTLTASVEREGNYVAIDISDTGKGIPKSQQRTVFQPGFTTKKRGWGLGLSLTKRIIETYHGGKIFVKHSEQGHGTTFRILLDAAPEVVD
ncbi:MAG: sensor histidine kinase [Flavobacteriales bacterium]|nr:sensor histidine kinase [Flavobacteriales bacterium]